MTLAQDVLGGGKQAKHSGTPVSLNLVSCGCWESQEALELWLPQSDQKPLREGHSRGRLGVPSLWSLSLISSKQADFLEVGAQREVGAVNKELQ